MLDTKTLKQIRHLIGGSDFNEVEILRDRAFEALTRLKEAERNTGLTAFERKDIALNIEIITRAEARLMLSV